MEAKEPVVAYDTTYMQGLKNKIVAAVDQTADEDKLEQCLELLSETPMPCCYTEEEFDEIVRQSEQSGYITHEEALKKFARWGFVK